MKKSNFLRILSYFKPHIPTMVISLIFALLVNAAELLSPYITKIVIDEYIIKGNADIKLELMGVFYLATVMGGAVFGYFQAYLLNLVGQKIIHFIRIELFSHIQHMPSSFFDKNSSGRIMTRATNDVESLNELYSGVIVDLFKDLFMIIGIVAVMLQMNYKLALISFTIVPIIILVTYFYNKKARWNFKRVRGLIAQINGFLAENISGMKLVQIFNREKEKYKEFEKLNGEYNKASIFEVVLMAFFRPGAELINNLSISILIWYCTRGVLNGALEIGLLYAFINYVKKFFDPIKDLADKYNTIQSGMVSAERIFELLDNNEGIEQLDKGIHIEEIKGDIEFKNVWFSYTGEEWVLKDVSFNIKAGETAAFVGATGSGKSTIISLIGRFYEIEKGQITIDGIDIKDISLRTLRKFIAVVMQDVFLFSGDIKSNISLSNKNICFEEVVQAANSSNASQFIDKLPNKFDEEVKERGCTLSSGQRQLLAFARALAFKPSILVLDEATANIDTENERIIQKALSESSLNRTTLVIAHRLSTIVDADKIIVIHKGRVREIGRHKELIDRNGIYKKLYELQYS
jgi:ATP-binding cassette, subfamily B, multidrug efflux pump